MLWLESVSVDASNLRACARKICEFGLLIHASANKIACRNPGFRERQTATDFRGVLLEHVKFLRRQAAAESHASEGDGEEEDGGVGSGPVQPTVDMSLQEGQKIRINLKNTRKPDAAVSGSTMAGSHTSAKTAAATAGMGLRPPPPAPTSAAKASEDDDWGDFETA